LLLRAPRSLELRVKYKVPKQSVLSDHEVPTAKVLFLAKLIDVRRSIAEFVSQRS
jgi:hypothetical protein